MQLPVSDLQQALDTVWPFRFKVEDDGEVMRVYAAGLRTEPAFDLAIVDTAPRQEVYWGPFTLVFMDEYLGVNRYRRELYFGAAVALIVNLVTFNDLDKMGLIGAGLPLEEWESLLD